MRKIPYFWLLAAPYLAFAVGFILNGIVVFANHHQMPVYPVGGDCSFLDADDLVHSCMTTHTHLKFLADWIVSGEGVSSIGDAFMDAFRATQIYVFLVWIVLIVRDIFHKIFY